MSTSEDDLVLWLFVENFHDFMLLRYYIVNYAWFFLFFWANGSRTRLSKARSIEKIDKIAKKKKKKSY